MEDTTLIPLLPHRNNTIYEVYEKTNVDELASVESS